MIDIDKLIEAVAVQTKSGEERQTHSRVGHSLEESSWYVHLAGFRSRAEAEAALAILRALKAQEARG